MGNHDRPAEKRLKLMGERIETASPLQMGPGWGLNLTAQRRQRMLHCRLLRFATPFLALGGRYLPPAVAARSPGLPAAIPWLGPRWLQWPDRDIAPAHAKEPAMGSPRAATPPVTFPAAHTHAQQQAQPPVALALALQSACTGPGTPGRGWSNFPARVSLFSGDLLPSAQSSPAPMEATVHMVRTRRETANMGMGSAFPQSRICPQISLSHSGAARQAEDLSAPEAKTTDRQIVPGAGGEAGPPLVSGDGYGPMPLRLPNMAPSWGSLGGFRGLTPGTFPASFYRIMTPAAPGHRAKQAELLLQSSPEEFNRPEMPPLPEHKLHGGRETVAPGPVPLQGLGLVMEAIRHTMKHEVAAAIRQREEEAQSPASSRSNGLNITAAENIVSDNLVRLFMQKMRKLSEEERFRLGLLR